MKEKKNMIKNDIVEKNLALLLLLMIVAYLFSMGVRMYWPLHFADVQSMYYAGELMINTNDGYAFMNAARDNLLGITPEDGVKESVHHYSAGLIYLTTYLTKLTPFSLDTVSLYLPGIISSFIVIPIILTARLVGNTLLGFFAALIGSIAWSYYNRTMIGYYDTDMFSVLLQFMIFYSFVKIIYEKSIFSVVVALFWVLIYPFFYSQGLLITYAMFILLVIYMFLEHQGVLNSSETKKFKENAISFYMATTLISIALMVSLSIELRVVLLAGLLIVLFKGKLEEKKLLMISALSFVAFLYFGNIIAVIIEKAVSYADRGLDEGALHFYQVVQTVREAGAIPFETMANRISGSQVGLVLSLAGYILLVLRHKVFIVALPLIGVGIFSLVGGLRFTVYAVPIAAISVVYLFFFLGDLIKSKIEDKKMQTPVKYLFVTLATGAMLYPNIKHIEEYLVPTVLNKSEVQDLVKLGKIASSKDYTLTWWDYGYPIWYYSNTNTLIDGGKHTHDNYIISNLLLSASPQQVSNLSKLAVETYVDSNYSMVADTIFKDKNPETLLDALEKKSYVLPPKTRDVYLYLPYRMLHIFPTVAVFGNLDLTTGKAKRPLVFYPARAITQKKNIVTLQNGIQFDVQNGYVFSKNQKEKVKRFLVTSLDKQGNIEIKSQFYHADGDMVVLYMKSYGEFAVMDVETFHSMYVQMFLLGKYDKNLFELVVSSPYSKIYRVK